MTKHFNLADLFEMVSDAVPQREAVVCGKNRATYAQLESRANKLANYFISQGVKKGQHVGLYLYNCNEYIEAMLACFKIRAVPINVNYRYVDSELAYIFDNADLVACIAHREFLPHIKAIHADFPALKALIHVDDESLTDVTDIDSISYEDTLRECSDVRSFPERADDDLFILYTGGTTGMPKGVMWPQKALFYAAMGGGGWFHPDGPIDLPTEISSRVTETSIVGMALAPLMHGACWWYACIQLLAGNTLILNPSHSLVGEEVWSIVEKEKVNALTIVGDAMASPLLEALTSNPKRWDLSSIFSIGSGGAVFSESKQEKFREYFPNVFIINSFGSSESGNMGFDGGGRKGMGLGNVARSEFMSVINYDESGVAQHVNPGEEGIFSRSGYIPIGYYNDIEKTAKTILDIEGKSWLLLGDEARLEDDGTITVFGRGSNCINSGGEKVFPEEVEQALKINPHIYDCLVVGIPDDRYGNLVAAVVAPKEGSSLDLHSMQLEVRKHVAGYKVPRQLHLVADVPRTPSGKPDYPKALQLALSNEFIIS